MRSSALGLLDTPAARACFLHTCSHHCFACRLALSLLTEPALPCTVLPSGACQPPNSQNQHCPAPQAPPRLRIHGLHCPSGSPCL